jgi:FkbM family methyltransferase
VGASVLYSCVVDATPTLYHQVMVWAWTAIELAHLEPSQLVVHAVDGCDDRLRRDLEGLGVRYVPVRRFPTGTAMCNKLVQLESELLLAQDRVVLSDCDLAWHAPIESRMFGDQPRAKVVDFANPPFELLAPLFQEAGFSAARTSTVSIGGAPTFHNNCNGGLYLLSGVWLRRLQEPWPRWLRWVESRAGQLGHYGIHIFQVSFALALEEIGATVDHLPLAYNVPTHSSAITQYPIEDEIRALHFHRAFGTSGELIPTGHARIDEAIAKANAVIREHVAAAWWLDSALPAPGSPEIVRLDGVHGRFDTRRRDHVTHQLETYGAHTRNEIAMLLAFVRPGDQVIDVGAHIGSFTVPLARAVGSDGHVVAVEPGARSIELLESNLALNEVAARVTARCALVAEQPAQYRAVELPEHTSATYYVLGESMAAPECCRLDSLASDLDPSRPLRLIKIDVEGMELSVLRSGAALIAARRPIIYVEVVAEQLRRYGTAVADIEAFLTERRYALFRNSGPRNSTSDEFQVTPLASLADGGPFFDCLAVPLERLGEEPALAGVAGVPERPWRRLRSRALRLLQGVMK